MARSIAAIQQEIRSLNMSEKEAILCTLMEELDGPPDEGVDAAWLEEIRRRGKEIESGAVQCIPASDVFASLEVILRK